MGYGVVQLNPGSRTMKMTGSTTTSNVVMAKWVRVTSFALTLMLAASVSFGFPLHSDSGCNPAEMQTSGCERMGLPPSPSVTGTVVCCLLDCQELGPAGTAFSVPGPVHRVVSLEHVALTPPITLRRLPQEQWLQSSAFTPPNTYLRNLALLI